MELLQLKAQDIQLSRRFLTISVDPLRLVVVTFPVLVVETVLTIDIVNVVEGNAMKIWTDHSRS